MTIKEVDSLSLAWMISWPEGWDLPVQCWGRDDQRHQGGDRDAGQYSAAQGCRSHHASYGGVLGLNTSEVGRELEN